MSKDVEVIVDSKGLKELGADILKAKRRVLRDLSGRGYELLTQEVPVDTGTLKKGVIASPVDYETMQAEIVVSATRDARASLTAEVFDKHGKKVKTVSLRAQPSRNYAADVAEGRPAIAPKTAHALLIPVPFAPTGMGYLMAGGQVYLVRKSAAAVAPNPFDQRAADRLQEESPKIGEAVLREFFK